MSKLAETLDAAKTQTENAASDANTARVDMKFEIVVIPVSDVNRAKEFYGRLGWRLDERGQQSAAIIEVDGGAIALPGAAPWYVDPEAHLAGPLEFDVPSGVAKLANGVGATG